MTAIEIEQPIDIAQARSSREKRMGLDLKSSLIQSMVGRKIVSIILLVVGVWFEGGISNNNAWLEKVHALEKKVAESEIKSAQANGKLTSIIAEKNKAIAETQASLKNKIKQFASILDTECKIPEQAISVLNEAAMPGPKGGKR